MHEIESLKNNFYQPSLDHNFLKINFKLFFFKHFFHFSLPIKGFCMADLNLYWTLLIMVFHITFVLALFHDKKWCNYINLFPCILWDFIVMSLVVSWWRLPKKLISRLDSWVVQPAKVTWGVHAKIEESSVRLYFASHFVTQAKSKNLLQLK